MKNNQVAKFFQYLLPPLLFGLALMSIWLYPINATVVLVSFAVNFMGFLLMFIWRSYRHIKRKEHLFKAAVTPSIGLAVELAGICIIAQTTGAQGVVYWVLALYLVMLAMLAIGLFAYALALKALEVMRKEEAKFKE